MLATKHGNFFLGSHRSHAAVFFHEFQFAHAFDAALDRRVIGQHAAEPTVDHVRLIQFFCDVFDRLLGLLLRTHEEDMITANDGVVDKTLGKAQLIEGFSKIDDIDAIAIAKDVRGHLRVPTFGLVTKMQTCLQQILNAHFGQGYVRFHLLTPCYLAGIPAIRFDVLDGDRDAFASVLRMRRTGAEYREGVCGCKT